MPRFTDSLNDWDTEAFARTLKREIEQLPPGTLPLRQGVSQGGQVDDGGIVATVIAFADDAETIQAKVGVFFTEVVGGCSCGDDPMAEHAYCELQVTVDKRTAEAAFAVLPG